MQVVTNHMKALKIYLMQSQKIIMVPTNMLMSHNLELLS